MNTVIACILRMQQVTLVELPCRSIVITAYTFSMYLQNPKLNLIQKFQQWPSKSCHHQDRVQSQSNKHQGCVLETSAYCFVCDIEGYFDWTSLKCADRFYDSKTGACLPTLAVLCQSLIQSIVDNSKSKEHSKNGKILLWCTIKWILHIGRN